MVHLIYMAALISSTLMQANHLMTLVKPCRIVAPTGIGMKMHATFWALGAVNLVVLTKLIYCGAFGQATKQCMMRWRDPTKGLKK